MSEEIINMKIERTSLTMADHGCLTFFLTISGGALGCNFGGFSLGHGYVGSNHFEGSAKGMEAIMRVMDTVGVDRWEDLTGKYIRMVYPGLGGSVKKIGHITENKWFDIEEHFKKEA